MSLSLTDLFARAELLPHSIDFAAGQLTFVRAQRSRVEQLPFIDGRQAFGEMGPSVPLGDMLGFEWERPIEPARYIFHVGFCGSTFLATVLQHAGVLALREPHILIDVSDAFEASPSDPAVSSLANLAADLLRRTWLQGESVVCKPSNWCNNLIPLLLDSRRQARAVFLTATPQEYLIAVLRGGSSRIENVARTAHHLLRSRPDGLDQWNEVMRSAADPLERGARLALVALEGHLRSFASADARKTNSVFSVANLNARPMDVVLEVAKKLELSLDDPAIAAAISLTEGLHSKLPGQSFSIDEREILNNRVRHEHARVIRGALAWGETALDLSLLD